MLYGIKHDMSNSVMITTRIFYNWWKSETDETFCYRNRYSYIASHCKQIL